MFKTEYRQFSKIEYQLNKPTAAVLFSVMAK